MKNKEQLKNDLSESKKNIKISTAFTAASLAADFGFANLHIGDISIFPIMATLVTIPVAGIVINTHDYVKTKKKIKKEEKV